MDAKEYLLNIESAGIKLGLDRTHALMGACGNPHIGLPVVQIAGTNGKGSTAAMMAKILTVAGYRVGLFTSPHLIDVNERIRINGLSITDDIISEFVGCYRFDIERISASFFECITALGFWYFARERVDVAIMETGLGGRLDSVSVCQPLLTVLTPISLDHMEILGNTYHEIATEKAGAMKRGVPCVSAPQRPDVQKIIEETAQDRDLLLTFAVDESELTFLPNIPGDFQYQNACLAEHAIRLLHFNVSDNNIVEGIETTTWYGRNQIISEKPLVIFDVGHNESGICGFVDYFSQIKGSGEATLVLSLQRRKNIDNITPLILKNFNRIICCETKNPRTMLLNNLINMFPDSEKIRGVPSAFDAIKMAYPEKKTDSLAIVGTHHLGDPVSRLFKISFNSL